MNEQTARVAGTIALSARRVRSTPHRPVTRPSLSPQTVRVWRQIHLGDITDQMAEDFARKLENEFLFGKQSSHALTFITPDGRRINVLPRDRVRFHVGVGHMTVEHVAAGILDFSFATRPLS